MGDTMSYEDAAALFIVLCAGLAGYSIYHFINFVDGCNKCAKQFGEANQQARLYAFVIEQYQSSGLTSEQLSRVGRKPYGDRSTRAPEVSPSSMYGLPGYSHPSATHLPANRSWEDVQ